jgi:hypothetical protein
MHAPPFANNDKGLHLQQIDDEFFARLRLKVNPFRFGENYRWPAPLVYN